MTLVDELHKQGYSLIPIGRDKRPLNHISWEPYKTRLPTVKEIEKWQLGTQTFAIIHGKLSRSFALDFEDEASFKEFFEGHEYLLELAMIVKTPHGGFHAVFKTSGPPRRRVRPFRKNGNPVPLDILGEVGYGIITGEIDHSFCDPKHANCPHHGPGKYMASGMPKEFPLRDGETVDSWILKRAKELGWKGTKFDPNVERAIEGERHETLKGLCSYLVNRGISNEGLMYEVLKFNDRVCKPPLPLGEVNSLVAWFTERNDFIPTRTIPDKKEKLEGIDFRLAQFDLITKAKERKENAIAIVAPTGTGKTLVDLFLTRDKPSIIVEPDRANQDQLMSKYGVHVVKGMSNYTCPETQDPVSESPCPITNSCSERCPYKITLEKGKSNLLQGKPVATNFANYHLFISTPPFAEGRGVVVFDEIHQLLGELSPAYRVPSGDKDIAMKFLTEEKSILEAEMNATKETIQNRRMQKDDLRKVINRYRSLQTDLQKIGMLLDHGSGMYIQSHRDGFFASLNEESILRTLISNGLYKKLFSTATFPYDVGIPVIKTDLSVVSRENGPIVVAPVARLNRKAERENPHVYDNLVFYIRFIYDLYKNGGRTKKAIIHTVSTQRAKKIGSLLSNLGYNVIIHSKGKLSEAIEAFRARDCDFLLTASGNTGLDFYGHEFGLQFILKVPYPDRSDPQWDAKAKTFGKENMQKDYDSATIIAIEQAAGRICRGPDDIGVTVILDAALLEFYERHKDLISKQFQERLIFLNDSCRSQEPSI